MTKPISPRLLALFAQRPVSLMRADIYAFTLAGGTTLRYTGADQDLTVNGQVYSSGGIQIGPYFGTSDNRGVIRQQVGAGTNSLTIEVIPGSALIGTTPFLSACRIGVFDNAQVKMSRVYMPTWGDTRRGPIPVFLGYVAEVDAGRSSAIFTINDFAELLDQPFPRNLYQPGCVNNLGDSACGVNLTALAVACTATGASTASVLTANFVEAPTGEFNQGKVVFTSGDLNGFSRTIKTATPGVPGTISLINPLPEAPSAGDTFNIFPGCDKTFAGTNGCAKFANQSRWRGEDLIPEAATAI